VSEWAGFRFGPRGERGHPARLKADDEDLADWVERCNQLVTGWQLIHRDDRFVMAHAYHRDFGTEFILWVKHE
jgi:hypothetical protein